MRRCWILVLAYLPASAMAADDPLPRITVSGSGRAMTPPDIATIEYGVRGEGASSDAAVAAMVARRKGIDAGLAALVPVAPTASQVAVVEVRGSACQRSYGSARLSTGDCAIVGYIATLTMRLRTSAVKQAGTIVGLLGRLEASEPRLTGFALADPQAVQRKAIAAALVDARRRAEAIAAGTGVALGRLVAASTGGYAAAEDIVVTAQRVAAPLALRSPPPIAVDLTPQPVETQAQVSVVYEIAR